VILLGVASGAHAAIFSNTSAITIPDSGQASLYPSEITVSGVTGTVTKVTVSVYNLNHTWADDIDMLLVGPGGQTVMLMSDQGYDDAISLNLTFDDDAAPAGPYGTLLSGFNGVDPNGTWSLYIMDDAANDSGSLSGGWELNITTGTGGGISYVRTGGVTGTSLTNFDIGTAGTDRLVVIIADVENTGAVADLTGVTVRR